MRRRRIVAATLLVGAIAALIGIVVSAGGGGSKRSASAKPAAHGRSSRPTTTATGVPAGGKPHRGPVPILMYHVIAPPKPSAPYPDLYVTPRDFSAQMKLLAAQGYHGVTLDQAYRAWHDGARIATKPIVITFDDGYRSVYKSARPVLARLGWPAVLNIEVGILTKNYGLNAEMVKKLIAQGWEVAAHTISHRDLTTLTPAQLKHEVSGSRDLLRRQFEVPVNFFCYPSGRYDDAVVAAVRKAGYLGATTTNPGLANRGQALTMSRVRVNGSDGVAGLRSKLGT